MHRSIAVLLLAAFAVMSATHLMAAIIPPIGLAPGSQYQLIFVTYDTNPGSSTDINTYNTFVRNEAALNLSLPATTWDAVASTDTVAANVNAPALGLPVYNTQGIEVASSVGIYTGSLMNPVAYDQFGNDSASDPGPSASYTWTGTNTDGSIAIGSALGDRFAAIGAAEDTDFKWIEGYGSFTGNPYSLYALSSAITVPTPEPATLTLFGSALVVLSGMRLLHGRNPRR